MTANELIKNVMREQGKKDALDFRSRASKLTGTEIINEEEKIPLFDENKDYSEWPVGAPVYDYVDEEKQIFTLLIPHNASYYPGVRPNNNRTLWSLAHTKNPLKAKQYIAPSGISGMYMKDEVCTDPNTNNPLTVYKSLVDNNVYSPSEYIQNWEEVII